MGARQPTMTIQTEPRNINENRCPSRLIASLPCAIPRDCGGTGHACVMDRAVIPARTGPVPAVCACRAGRGALP